MSEVCGKKNIIMAILITAAVLSLQGIATASQISIDIKPDPVTRGQSLTITCIHRAEDLLCYKPLLLVNGRTRSIESFTASEKFSEDTSHFNGTCTGTIVLILHHAEMSDNGTTFGCLLQPSIGPDLRSDTVTVTVAVEAKKTEEDYRPREMFPTRSTLAPTDMQLPIISQSLSQAYDHGCIKLDGTSTKLSAARDCSQDFVMAVPQSNNSNIVVPISVVAGLALVLLLMVFVLVAAILLAKVRRSKRNSLGVTNSLRSGERQDEIQTTTENLSYVTLHGLASKTGSPVCLPMENRVYEDPIPLLHRNKGKRQANANDTHQNSTASTIGAYETMIAAVGTDDSVFSITDSHCLGVLSSCTAAGVGHNETQLNSMISADRIKGSKENNPGVTSTTMRKSRCEDGNQYVDIAFSTKSMERNRHLPNPLGFCSKENGIDCGPSASCSTMDVPNPYETPHLYECINLNQTRNVH